eukprot:10141288-Karenia_brevis.AAC.1
MSAAHAVKFSAGLTRAIGGVATSIHNAATRCDCINGNEEFIVWNMHNIGLDTETIGKCGDGIKQDVIWSKGAPGWRH